MACPKLVLQEEEMGSNADLMHGDAAETPAAEQQDYNFETSHRLDIDWRDEPL